MRLTKFKKQHRQTPPRSGTPPPPAYEPLSPVLPTTGLPTAHPAGGYDKNVGTFNHTLNKAPDRSAISIDVRRAHLSNLSTSGTYDSPLRSAPLPRPTRALYSSDLASPIDTLADAAVSLRPTEATIEPSHHSPPAFAAHGGVRASSHTYPDAHYANAERPSKRARSELFPSPLTQSHVRPATSHVPRDWSYNVEHMMDTGTRMYQEHSQQIHHLDDSNRLSDAQLLLEFSWQSHASAAKRWSISHIELPEPIPVPTVLSAKPILEPPHPLSLLPVDCNHLALQVERIIKPPPKGSTTTPAVQIQTPPDENSNDTPPSGLQHNHASVTKKLKKHQGWPKGKPRGPRSSLTGAKRKKSTPKPKSGPSTTFGSMSGQLHSPQSLPGEGQRPQRPFQEEHAASDTVQGRQSFEPVTQIRRHSFSIMLAPTLPVAFHDTILSRSRSVPPQTRMTLSTPDKVSTRKSRNDLDAEAPTTICSGCNSSESDTLIGDGEQWINCDGCKGWFHFGCAGFKSEREVRDVDKFYCGGCSPKFGKTTKVRKSARTHTAVDYAGLNEGIMKSSDDNPEHHYIQGFKNGDIELTKENFARLPPELVSADYLEKTNGFKEPIVITAVSNPRPACNSDAADVLSLGEARDNSDGHESVPDDGQDLIDMVIPAALTVRRVAELYGPLERVDVIDVKLQEGESGKWTMSKWADYYEQQGDKPVRNVISLEVSQSKLGRLIRRPKAVRDLDLQDSVWPEEDRLNAPKVQFYCLMSVADCYTDFHIDFGGSSVYYHIIKGRKTFFFIAPTKQNLKKYEDWCLSPRQSHEFLGDQVKECYRVDLFPGDTMLIPSGWIHAVWTPEDSLVIGGNFLTRIHYAMQIRVAEIEKNTKVAKKFRYPFFQKLMWFSLIRYLEEDPIPASVEELLLSGSQFKREVPIYCEPNNFGHNSAPGPEYYNKRYYSKAELEGLADLANYIWRTVMISLGKIDGITQVTKNAVTRSIPKGHGEPLILARRFARWIAWKRGNEGIPQWAYPDTMPASEATEFRGEKKLTAAQVKRLEREALSDALHAAREAQSPRMNSVGPSPPNGAETSSQSSSSLPFTGFLRPTREPSKFLTTPKTSQLGPKRIACDACRKRRIRCKHKDELVETPKWEAPPAGPITGSAGTGPMTATWSLGTFIPRRESEENIVASSLIDPALLAGAQGLQGAQVVQGNANGGGPISPDVNYDGLANRSGRVKACPDCRKSKRRCIHDENGNVDPVKASEAPVPRGSATKKRRISDEDGLSTARGQKGSPFDGEAVEGDSLQDRDFSQTPSRTMAMEVHDMMIDPFLDEAFARHPTGQPMATPGHTDLALDQHNGTARADLADMDAVIHSIEDLSGDPMDDLVDGNGEWPVPHQPPPVEPLTPGPTPFALANGASPYQDVSPHHVTPPEKNHVTISTPVVARSVKALSSGKKASQTPRPNRTSTTPHSGKGRRDSKDYVHLKSEESPQKEADMASFALALQLQMEEHGLRRRSK